MGHTCVHERSADELRSHYENGGARPDLILVGEEPDGRGHWPLLEAAREVEPQAPILVLSSCDDADRRLAALRAGADECLPASVHGDELRVRVENLGRRRGRQVLTYGSLVIDCATCIVMRDGQRIRLSAHGTEVLRVLLDARGAVVPKTRLLKEVWDLDFDPGTTVVEVQIARLRRRLAPEGPSLIRTLVGQGYAIDYRA